MNKKLTGIITALVTPFDNNGKIMYDALQHHVDYLVNQGVEGFYVNGSTGESFLMTPDERKNTLEAVIEANAGRATIISHCGAIGTDLSLDLVKHSANLAVDAISSVPPFYYGFSKDELVSYYNDLANASDKPFIVYNMPKFSGVVITPSLMAELRKNPRIQGLKFTHNDFFALERIKTSDPDLIIYNGYDEMAICGMSLGCDGAIGSTYNVLAPMIIKLRDQCAGNDYQAALKTQREANGHIASMVATGKLFAVLKKVISIKEGIDFGICRRPFASLGAEDIAYCERLAGELPF